MAVLEALDVSRETRDRLAVYAELLGKWSSRINLVAPGTLEDAARRHFADSAQLWPLATCPGSRWIDLGSGAGFPGLVIAILAAEKRPDLTVTMVESDQRKAAFLRTVSRETGVDVLVQTMRAEALDPQQADIVSARALAPLPRLLPLVQRHLRADGQALLPKGRDHAAEIAAARAKFRFALEIHCSRTDPEAVILSIGAIEHV